MELFKQQEIDGGALMCLTEDILVQNMRMKLGPAIKICAGVRELGRRGEGRSKM